MLLPLSNQASSLSNVSPTPRIAPPEFCRYLSLTELFIASDSSQSGVTQATQAVVETPHPEHQDPSFVQQTRNAPSQESSRTAVSGTRAEHIAFTSPDGQTTYTRSELDELARGKPNSNGDLVFFKPGFVSEDPWFRLRSRKGDTNK